MSFEFLNIIRTKKISTNPIDFLRDIQSVLKKIQANNQRLTIQTCYFLAYYFYHLFTAQYISETNRIRIQSIMQIFNQVNKKTLGSFMNFLMSEKYVQSMRQIPKYEMKDKLSIDILQLLKNWIKEYQLISNSIKNKKKIDIFGIIATFLCRNNQYTQIQDKILIINYIYSDILVILPSFIMNVNQPIPQNEIFHVDSLLKLIQLILPQTLFRIQMDFTNFPEKLIDFSQNLTQKNINLIYINENLQSSMLICEFYTVLLKTLLKSLIDHLDQLSDQCKQKIVNFVFRFYQVYHAKSKKQAQEFIVQCFSNLSKVIKFAISQKVVDFFQIVKQFNQYQFLQKVINTFDWIKQIVQKLKVSRISRELIDPFCNSSIKFSVMSNNKQIRYLQIYRDFSLIYFDICCKNADINIKFVYVGDFYDKTQSNVVLLENKRLKVGQFYRGTFNAFYPGIYYFEFDNTYSWITTKSIQFRYSVLASINIQYINYNKEYMRLYSSQIRGHSKQKLLKVKGQRKISMQLSDDEVMMMETDEENLCEMSFNPPLYYIKIFNKKTNHKFEYQLETNNLDRASIKIYQKLNKYMKDNRISDMNSLMNTKYQKVAGQSLQQFISRSIKQSNRLAKNTTKQQIIQQKKETQTQKISTNKQECSSCIIKEYKQNSIDS